MAISLSPIAATMPSTDTPIAEVLRQARATYQYDNMFSSTFNSTCLALTIGDAD